MYSKGKEASHRRKFSSSRLPKKPHETQAGDLTINILIFLHTPKCILVERLVAVTSYSNSLDNSGRQRISTAHHDGQYLDQDGLTPEVSGVISAKVRRPLVTTIDRSF